MTTDTLTDMLPVDVDYTQYWQERYHQPVAHWQPALETIRTKHGLPAGDWQRFDLGRNVVFALGDELVIKLIPPFWQLDAAREAAALEWVHGRLPVTTPTLLTDGEINGWRYLVETRLPGRVLRWLWPDLNEAERVTLAAQHGEIMAALHNLSIANAPAALQFDWHTMIDEQWQVCAEEMSKAGVPTPLLQGLADYLSPQRAMFDETTAAVLLHGDLNFLNFLVEEQQGRWQITGLIDWSDAKIGPVAHELLSPGVHMYRGARRLLHAWYAGYSRTRPLLRSTEFEQHVMARAMLYYADTFHHQLSVVPGALDCTRWADVARCFWHLCEEE